MVEQGTENPRVIGSIPIGGTICGFSSSGRAPPCLGGGSEFEPRKPLQEKTVCTFVQAVFCFAVGLGAGRRRWGTVSGRDGTSGEPCTAPRQYPPHRLSALSPTARPEQWSVCAKYAQVYGSPTFPLPFFEKSKKSKKYFKKTLDFLYLLWYSNRAVGRRLYIDAALAHLVERHLAKVEVASSSLVSRSRKNSLYVRTGCFFALFLVWGRSLPHPARREQARSTTTPHPPAACSGCGGCGVFCVYAVRRVTADPCFADTPGPRPRACGLGSPPDSSSPPCRCR